MHRLAYVSVEEAVALPGLRVAFSQGVPGPWGVGARAILEYKAIPFVAVPQIPGGANEALQRWTGQPSAPVAVYEDERPRASWSEIILLAERLAPEPRLIPADAEDRAAMFGLCHELCAEDGLGWSIRAMLFSLRGRDPQSLLARRYASGMGLEHAQARANAVVAMLGRLPRGRQPDRRGLLLDRLLSSAARLPRGGLRNAGQLPGYGRAGAPAPGSGPGSPVRPPRPHPARTHALPLRFLVGS
jgi:hypothetical protein